MKILVSGSTGLVGTDLVGKLLASGHAVTRLVRRRGDFAEPQILWDPDTFKIDHAALDGFDAVVHLAGENIVGRWTEEHKRRVRDSRVNGTKLLAESLAIQKQPPGIFIGASAMGYYGTRGDEILTEESSPGTGYMAEVCTVWEAACEPMRSAGARVVNLRIGMVLSPTGGALKMMLPFFKLGLGGRLGNGRQWISWISLDDVVGAIEHCLGNEAVRSSANFGSPNPVTNADFTKALGRALHRLTPFPAPAWALRLALGEMADAALLASIRMQPRVLLESGYDFRHKDLNEALSALLARRV